MLLLPCRFVEHNTIGEIDVCVRCRWVDSYQKDGKRLCTDLSLSTFEELNAEGGRCITLYKQRSGMISHVLKCASVAIYVKIRNRRWFPLNSAD